MSRLVPLLTVTFYSATASPEPLAGTVTERWLIGLGFSAASGKRFSAGESRSEHTVTLQVGRRLRSSLWLVGHVNGEFVSPTTSSTYLDERHVLTMVGIRWAPDHVHKAEMPDIVPYKYAAISAFYVQAAFGLDIMNARNLAFEPKAALSAVASIVAGWVPMQGDDYAFGLEAHSCVSRFAETEGTFDILVVAQLRR